MHGSLFFFVFTTFLLSSCSLSPLSCTTAAILGRRVLSDSSSPPPPPPLPPLTTTTPPEVRPSSDSTTNGSPFFPYYSSTPPPPPPSTFATFPANISALVLPRSPEPKPGSRKLLVPAISAVLSAATVAGLLFFLYRRWRRQHCHFADEAKSSDSESSRVLCPPPNLVSRNTSNKLPGTGCNSEVLYLGNVVNSHHAEGGYNGVDDPNDSANPDSPEISPLPPLLGHSFRQNYEADSSTEEEEEEFYSPLASLAGTESSSVPGYGYGSGYGSRLRLVGQESGARNVAYSTCSCSSSTSASPARSQSVTISPPMSSTFPQRLDRRDSDASSDQNPQSPTLSLASSPGRGSTDDNRCESWRIFSFWNQNAGLPRISSVSTSPDTGMMIRTPDGYARTSLYSSASTSPDGVFGKDPNDSQAKYNDFNRNVQTVLLPSNSASPRRESGDNLDNSNVNVNPPEKITEVPKSIQNISAPLSMQPPPRPPPPPPPQLLQSQPLSGQRIPVPPPLVPPSRPFVAQRAGKSLSFSDLPSSSSEAAEQPKPKLKPLHWDKVRANSGRGTAWDRLQSSSFKLNEEMMEKLFVANPTGSNRTQRTPSLDPPMLSSENQVLDPKKAQNISILLRALNVTADDVCQVLLDGDSDALGIELLGSLSRMAPDAEEEQKLKNHKDDSPIKLGLAEKFLKKVLDVPFGFKRVDALLYVANFDFEVKCLQRSFEILQAACEELKNSRLFLKLLEAVLKTGNRMNVGTNRGDAHAFKLDTLLKLVDVKGADGKTTLLHFVLQEIIRSEGLRLLETVGTSNSSMNEEEEESNCCKLGLQVVGNLSSELADVRKSADMDYGVIRGDVSKLSQGIKKINEVLQLNEEIGFDEEQRQKFRESMTRFLETAQEEIKKIETLESCTITALKEITEYFHGDSAKEEAHPCRIFVVVRDFLAIVDQICKEVSMVREHRSFRSSRAFQF